MTLSRPERVAELVATHVTSVSLRSTTCRWGADADRGGRLDLQRRQLKASRRQGWATMGRRRCGRRDATGAEGRRWEGRQLGRAHIQEQRQALRAGGQVAADLRRGRAEAGRGRLPAWAACLRSGAQGEAGPWRGRRQWTHPPEAAARCRRCRGSLAGWDTGHACVCDGEGRGRVGSWRGVARIPSRAGQPPRLPSAHAAPCPGPPPAPQPPRPPTRVVDRQHRGGAGAGGVGCDGDHLGGGCEGDTHGVRGRHGGVAV